MAAFDVEITDLRGFILATTRADRDGMAPDDGDPVVFRDFSDLEVSVPLSDTREARVTFDIYSDAAQFLWYDGIEDDEENVYRIGALGRMVRIYLRTLDQPVFWGVIVLARWNAQSARVEVTAQDQSFRLKKHFARYGDVVVGDSGDLTPPQSPTDYTTIRALVEAAENTPAQSNYPPLGIDIASGTNDGLDAPWVIAVDASAGTFTLTFDGYMTSAIAYNASGATLQSALEALFSIGVGDIIVDKPEAGLWTVTFTYATTVPMTGNGGALTGDLAVGRSTIGIERGRNIWDVMVEIRESRYGPDIELDPRDDLGVAGTDDDGGTWPYYCVLNTWSKQQVDRTGTLTFKYVEDADDNNLEDFDWEPSGDVVRNQVTMVTQGTESTPGLRVFGHDLDSWTDLGIFVDWQNPEGGNAGNATRRALQDLAHDTILAYSRPPNFFTLHVRPEDADDFDGMPRYITDYGVGDLVSVECQKGWMQLETQGRIIKVTLHQLDQAGNVRTEIECVPSVTSDGSVTTGDDD